MDTRKTRKSKKEESRENGEMDGERGEASLKGEREGEEIRWGLGAFNGEFRQRSVLVHLPALPGYQAFLQGCCWSQDGRAPMPGGESARLFRCQCCFPCKLHLWAACARNLARRARGGRPPPDDETDTTVVSNIRAKVLREARQEAQGQHGEDR